MFKNNRKEFRTTLFVSLIGVAVLFVLEAWILFLAGNVSGKKADELMVQDFLERGNRIATMVASSPLLTGTNMTDVLWRELPSRIQPLSSLFPSLRYIEISQGDAIVFSSQLPPPEIPRALPDTKVYRRRMNDFQNSHDVAAFRIDDVHGNGTGVSVEIGLSRDALESGTASAYRESIRHSLHLGVVLFAICAIAGLFITAWRVFYERRVLARQREEEHLLFSGVLANSIVHDFRNPMSSLKLDIQMLGREWRRKGGIDPERVAKLTDRIEKTLGRMDEIFREFLYLSRPADSTCGEFDLRASIDSSLELLAPRLEAQHLKCRFDAPLGPVMVVASEVAVRRATVNVLLNAIQHSPDGGSICITALLDGNFWQIDIMDEGPGIPVADREKIFDMFYTKRSGGTGLGLFMTRAALTNCGGSICVCPSNGGALFRIRIPAVRSVASAERGSVENG